MSLATALVIGLTYYMTPGLAAVITGIALLIAGGMIVSVGLGQLRKTIERAGESLNP
jgi:hypothetical protein